MFKSGFVAIIGRPNAGKSTLLNQVLGTRLSIVTPKAQTTRDRVLGIFTEPKQGQIVFVDTPGIHRAKEGGINAYMMNEAKEALEEPSLVWYIVDPASALKHEEAVLTLLTEVKTPVILILNKLDLISGVRGREGLNALEKQLLATAAERGIRIEAAFGISAEKGKGVKDLLKKTWEILPEGPLYYPDEDQVSDRPTRFFVAEKIREQLLMQLGEELPYSCAVEIEKFEEPSPPKSKLTRIEAMIYVERDSQKGMVIGKGGKKIKDIGQAARAQIEEFVGGPVFLGLRVKVLKDWSKDAETLRRIGYNLPEVRK